ncbi:hypothetical protein TrRE_jg4363 [Triparma retinervis]|uniref:Uncharacterized protein n=1 Tax=Triparma retinervis TaxID=2557542 RepID=A0A9W7KRL3_9STRA|nr:hypothetical protein TrRE_jg4363 [Triparma retinervis]
MTESPASTCSVNQEDEDHTMGPASNPFSALGTPGSVASADDSIISTGKRTSKRLKRQSLSVIQQSSSSSKSLLPTSGKKEKKRRKSLSNEAIDFGPSAEEEQEDLPPMAGDDLPPLAGSPTPPPKSKKSNARRMSSIGPAKSDRRQTAESTDLRDLMATLQNSARRGTMDSFNTARDSMVSTPGDPNLGTAEKAKKKKEKKNNRRLTADGADLESLLAGLNDEAAASDTFHDASSSSSPQVAFASAPTPIPTNSSFGSPNLSISLTDVSNASSANTSVSSRVPTPHAKFANSSSTELDDEDEDVPPLPSSPIEPPKRTRSKRAASLGGAAQTQPKGILNKNKGKKRKKGRKSVAFGSPQAAEFNSSSPSASLTPMPTEAAKLKYIVPDNSMMSESSADTSTASASMMNITADSNNGNFESSDHHDGEDDNTVELEGDINALMTSVSQGHGTNEMDEDENTVELEGDISTLLANAVNSSPSPLLNSSCASADTVEADTTVELEGDLSQLLSAVTNTTNTLRRLSGESGGNLASATKSSPTAHHVNLALVTSPNSSFDAMMAAANNMPMVDLSKVKLDVCCKEIVNFCERGETKSFAQLVQEIESKLLDACYKSQTITPPITASPGKKNKKLTFSNNFVMGVVDEVLGACAEEVTAKMSETRSGGSKILSDIKAHNPDMLKTIQLGIRRSNTSPTCFPENIRNLYKKVQKAVLNDWTRWEEACTQALVKALKERKTEAEAELATIKEHEEKIEDALAKVKKSKSKAALKAKNEVLLARTATLDGLTADNSSLSAELKALEQEVAESSARATKAEEFQEKFVKAQAEKLKMAAATKELKLREKKFKMLEGLLLFSPVMVDSGKIIVDFTGGQMEETKVSLGFDLTDPTSISCFMLKKEEDKGRGKKRAKRRPKAGGGLGREAREFAKRRMEAVMDFVNNDLDVKSGKEIPNILQNIEFQIGRIELIAQEIGNLGNKFDSVLEYNASTGFFSLTLDFISRTQTAKLRAVFDVVDEDYPFTPLDAVLENVIGVKEVDKVGDLIRRNAEPGFGYLKRACDTISVYMK